MKNLILLALLFTGFAQAQVINIPDANFKAKLLQAAPSNTIASSLTGENVQIDTNNDGEIQLAEAASIGTLQFENSGIQDFTGLQDFVNLVAFASSHNAIAVLNLNGMQHLASININYNTSAANTAYSFADLPELATLAFYYSNVTSITTSGLPNLSGVYAYGNPALATLHLIDLTALTILNAPNGAIADLAVNNSPLLTEINLEMNNLQEITINNFPLLNKLLLGNNQISDVSGFSNLNNLKHLNLGGNLISNLALPALPQLQTLYCWNNSLSSISLNYPLLTTLGVSGNNISTLDFSGVPLLESVLFSSCPIASVDLSGLQHLSFISCEDTPLPTLDLSHNPALKTFSLGNMPQLVTVNLKNGIVNKASTNNMLAYSSSVFYNMPNLLYICIDEGDEVSFDLLDNPPVNLLTTYCTFTPGGNYNTIKGKFAFDADNNGCDPSDASQSLIKVKLNDGTNDAYSFTNAGNYNFYTQAGTFVIASDFETPSYFTSSPVLDGVNFPLSDGSTANKDFCITANGVHPDLEIAISPEVPARPGFDAVYRIVYRNKGNQVMTMPYGISFFYNQNQMDFVSSTPSASSAVSGSVNWDYSDLQPFESRSMVLKLHVHAPTDANPVNIGEMLTLTANIQPGAGDETASDNIFLFHQTVVGSYDPNDITCMEGAAVPTDAIGDYLHYAINFENTGTDYAENIVVRSIIDPAQFELSSLQLLSTSHPAEIRLSGNVLEIIFKNIYLQTGGHGNILLKIKSKSSLTPGSVVAKSADIFFDYNFPVATNIANTVFQNLGIGLVADNSIGVSPNPAQDFITIKADDKILSVQLYDIQGRLLQTSWAHGNSIDFDLSGKTQGVYFLKVKTEKGAKAIKVLKN